VMQTDTVIPWKVFQKFGFDVAFIIENGNVPSCDKLFCVLAGLKSYSGWQRLPSRCTSP